MLIEVECKNCSKKFYATLEQLDHYFYCPSCQHTGNINHLFRIIAVET